MFVQTGVYFSRGIQKPDEYFQYEQLVKTSSCLPKCMQHI